MNNEIAIKVKNISKVYKLYDKPIDRMKEALSINKKTYHKEFYALNDISFEANKGETIGIIGTNGSGKSTLLKLITGVATPTQGTVEVNGKVSALLELGAGFNPEYTGIENIYLNGTMMGYSKEEMNQKVSEIIQFADIGDFINQPVKNYSSGMFARLAFAVAINIEPEVLIVDEALSVGDVFFQNKCFKKFEELRARNTTILFVSHDVSSIKEMCSRVLWIEKGIQQMFGDTVEVCNAYTNSILEKNGKELELEDEQDKQYYSVKRFNLESYPSINYGNESILNENVKILSTFILDKNKKITNELKVEEEYTVVLIFESNIEIKQCIAGFVIETLKGVWVINSNSIICGEQKSFIAIKNGLNRIEFNFKLPKLIKGDYVVGVAISEGTKESFKVLTWLYNVLAIKIINEGANSAIIDVDTTINVFQREKDL
ncbi:MAG: ABC transporter ATP-binding protein [Clostridiales bacterium]|nr:ABC transporter ATP-binding protein [Clostridiales bacterium]